MCALCYVVDFSVCYLGGREQECEHCLRGEFVHLSDQHGPGWEEPNTVRIYAVVSFCLCSPPTANRRLPSKGSVLQMVVAKLKARYSYTVSPRAKLIGLDTHDLLKIYIYININLSQISDNVQRGNYAQLNDKDVSHFEQLLGKNYVLTEDLEGYNICFLKRIRGGLAG